MPAKSVVFPVGYGVRVATWRRNGKKMVQMGEYHRGPHEEDSERTECEATESEIRY